MAKTTGKSKKAAPVKKGRGKRQIALLLTFFFALFMLIVTFVPGSSFWNMIHNFNLGISGFSAVFWWGLVMFVTARLSFGAASKKFVWRLVGIGLFVFLLQTLLEIALRYEAGMTFGDFISAAYAAGWWSGGFFGALPGYPIAKVFGGGGAVVVLIIVMVIDFLLVTGITLYQFVSTVTKPAKKITNDARAAYERKKTREDFRKKDFDVSLDGMETNPPDKSVEQTLEEKAQRLISIYNDEPLVTSEKAAPEQEKAPEADQNIEKLPVDLDEIISKLNGSTEDENEVEKKPKKLSKADLPEGLAPDTVEFEGEEPEEYRYPPISLLDNNENGGGGDIGDELKQNAALLVDTLKSFGVETRIVDISRGPTVTRYELQPAAGVKISKITGLVDDIALNLATEGVRIEAPIPNKAAVGIEVPNKNKNQVFLRDVIDTDTFANAQSKLTVAVGKDIAGNVVTADLSRMPHLLIAGTTGSGKSVCINSFIISVLYKSSPQEVKLLLIDPKVVELEVYNGLPHLLVPVVTEPRKASGALGWAVSEMERRYKIFGECKVRDLQAYNELARVDEKYEPMPQILIVVDELNDLMMIAPSEVEDSICRLAQKARAAGMNLVIATQRPSVDVLTGLIKANVPSRIALKVANRFDSATILDTQGAEKLLGYGDMLFYPVGLSKPTRVQGCWISDEEIKRVVSYIIGDKEEESKPVYSEEIEMEIERHAVETKAKKASAGEGDDGEDEDGDELLEEAFEVCLDAGIASTSLLQRKLRVGHSRAGRIMDIMEIRGLVGPYEGSKPRKLLITRQQWQEMKMNSVD